MDILSLGTGFFLGLRHSLDPDHVAAVAQFASADPRPSRGLLFGLRWGAGHGAAVLLLGAALVPAGLSIGGRYEHAAEILVGVVLIGLALWRLYHLLAVEHVHPHRHADGVEHVHPHQHGASHVHTHAPTATGFVHGSAGVLGVIALLPLASGGWLERAFLLLAFCAGSLLSMGLFGAFAARLFASFSSAGRWLWLAAGTTAVAGFALGVLWIARSL
jgi:hypothetical protein